MENIHVEGTAKKPFIRFEAENGLIEMGGKSILEDPTEFYQPLASWILEYANNPQPHTHVNFKFEYFNTSASKWIIVLAKQLKEIGNSGGELTISWYYDDEDLLDYGMVVKDLVDMPIRMIPME